MEHRDYQHEAVDELWKEILTTNHALLVASTGLGKTEIIILLLKKCLEVFPQLRCVFLVNKVKLLDQTIKRLSRSLGPIAGRYDSKEKNLSLPITVATIQSINSVEFDGNLIIVDETHAINMEGGYYKQFIDKCELLNPKVKTVGCTATPFRTGQGYIYGEGKFFKKPCYEKGLMWAIENEFLVRPLSKKVPEQFDVSKLRTTAGDYNKKDLEKLTMDTSKIDAQVKDALSRTKDRNKVVWACISINHAQMVYDKLTEYGELSIIVHSKKNNDKCLRSFEEDDKVKHLVFITIVSEGYDFPPIDTVVLMRPTKSSGLYVQTVGRGLRPSDNKSDCLVLDYGRVVESCGRLDKPNVSSKKIKSKDKIKSTMKFCKICLEYCDISAKECPECNNPFETPRPSPGKNLTINPSDKDLLNTERREFFVRMITIEDDYISSKKNKMYRITYTPYDLLGFPVYEYFAQTDAASYYFRKRIEDIKKYKGSINVKCIKSNGYWKPESLGAGDSERYSTLFKLPKDFLF